MILKIYCLVFILWVVRGSVLHVNNVSDIPSYDYLSICQLRHNLSLFAALPGLGWDNLQNKELGKVLKTSYSECQKTSDALYLLPNEMFSVPIRSSHVEQEAEFIDDWRQYTSTTSSSVNHHAGVDFEDFGISGTYSHEQQTIRTMQYNDQTVTTRVQLRYIPYTVKVQPGAELEDEFKNRLLKIASFLLLNKKQTAQYESQLLVRDFGTHVITSVDAGAVLSQTDQIDKSTIVKEDDSETINRLTINAGAIFKASFGIVSGTTSNKVTDDSKQSYMNNRSHSVIDAFGGPLITLKNFNIDDWIRSVSSNPVTLDQSGIPIYFVITTQNFPLLPSFLVYELYQTVSEAVAQYYKRNMYKGCTDQKDPNFSFQANIDDGTCKKPQNNYTFGGVYQTCQNKGTWDDDYCNDNQLSQKNPLTGDFTCLGDNYESILLHSGSDSKSKSIEINCHHCGFLWRHTCCDHKEITVTATYETYWCAASGHTAPDSGYIFGGVYTDHTVNMLTQSRSCPQYFISIKILDDLHVCVSDDYELALGIPFSGFYSCDVGNPLKLHFDLNTRKRRSSSGLMLGSFVKNSGPSHWPRGCPDGYSDHLAEVVDSCEIYICLRTGVLKQLHLPNLQRPPFMKIPSSGFTNPLNDSIPLTTVVSDNGLQWAQVQVNASKIQTPTSNSTLFLQNLQSAMNTLKGSGANADPPDSNKSTLPVGATVTIAVLSVIVFALILVLVMVTKRKNRSLSYFEL